MDLLPAELREKIPRLGSAAEVPLDELLVYTKFFDPTSQWRWYVLQFDGENTFFGFVLTTDHALAGQFTLSELQNLRYHHQTLGEVGVERDTYFRPISVAELKKLEPVIGEIFKTSGLKLVNLETDN